jgi:hypothetical protein
LPSTSSLRHAIDGAFNAHEAIDTIGISCGADDDLVGLLVQAGAVAGWIRAVHYFARFERSLEVGGYEIPATKPETFTSCESRYGSE